MKILFTGGSSFTGYWLIRELAAEGHEITAVFRSRAEDYGDEIRRQRVALVSRLCRPVHRCSFGDDVFLSLVREGKWDLLCHHAADVTNYKSPDFDVMGAVQNNSRNLSAVLGALEAASCSKIVLTGSVFEGGEGAGSEGLPDLSAYGLSKALTARVFRFHCGRAGIHLRKFVIPNPFGPHEEPRFTAYLMKNWFAGATPSCSTPAYVRDNIHVSLLAKVYAHFAGAPSTTPGFTAINPSGYIESQGAFALRVAQETRSRLNLPCPVELKHQAEFSEPRIRINTDVPDARSLGWIESQAWDEFAAFYERIYAKSSK